MTNTIFFLFIQNLRLYYFTESLRDDVLIMDKEDEFSHFAKNIACQLHQLPLVDALQILEWNYKHHSIKTYCLFTRYSWVELPSCIDGWCFWSCWRCFTTTDKSWNTRTNKCYLLLSYHRRPNIVHKIVLNRRYLTQSVLYVLLSFYLWVIISIYDQLCNFNCLLYINISVTY